MGISGDVAADGLQDGMLMQRLQKQTKPARVLFMLFLVEVLSNQDEIQEQVY